MIEIGFNGPTTGNLTAAAAYNGLFKEDGDNTETLMLEFLLDIGLIDNEIIGEYRSALLGELYMFRGVDDSVPVYEDESDEEAKESFKESLISQWDRFLKCLDRCNEIRIWVSTSAQSYCGLMHLCDFLEDRETIIHVVEVPRYIEGRCKDYFIKGWEQCEPQDLADNISLSRELSRGEIHIYANMWRKLKKENSEYRVLVSGSVISVNADFYDFLIRKHIPEGEFEQAIIIRDFYREDVNTEIFWIERRIESMIESGELVIVSDSKDKYKRVLRKHSIHIV